MKLDKKLLCIIIAAATLFIAGVVTLIVFLSEDENLEPPGTLMELACETLDPQYEFALVGDEGEVVLTADDVDKVYIMYIMAEGENRYLEIRFKEDSIEKFEDAIDDYDELSITLDGEVLVKGVVANEYDSSRAKLEGDYKTLMNYFNKLT